MSGPCLDQATATFPVYPLNGRVQRDITDVYRSQGGRVRIYPSYQKKLEENRLSDRYKVFEVFS